MDAETKTLGQVIDEVIGALKGLEDDESRLVAIRAACQQLKIPIGAAEKDRAGTTQVPPVNLTTVSPEVTDIRSLKEIKQPATAKEMACIVAYYLQSVAPADERRDLVEVSDLDKYFRQANYPLPRRLHQLLVDAKGAGYFDSPSRGAYRLNAVGHNLVVHTLPRGAAQSAVNRPRRSSRRPQKRSRAR